MERRRGRGRDGSQADGSDGKEMASRGSTLGLVWCSGSACDEFWARGQVEAHRK